MNTGHLSQEIMKEIGEEARMSLFKLKKTSGFVSKATSLYLSQVRLRGGKSFDRQCPASKLDLEKPQCFALSQNQFRLICIFWTTCQAMDTPNTMSQLWNCTSLSLWYLDWTDPFLQHWFFWEPNKSENG